MSALFIGFVYMATISGFVLNILAYFSVIFTAKDCDWSKTHFRIFMTS